MAVFQKYLRKTIILLGSAHIEGGGVLGIFLGGGGIKMKFESPEP